MYSFVILAANALSKTDGGDGGLGEKIATFFDYIIGRVPSWIAGLIMFVLAFVVAKIAKSAVESRISDQIDEEHQEVLILAGRVSYFGTLIVCVTIALKIAGIDLTTILAAVAFGIGFALQDLIMNFLSGVLLLLNRQFTIGDFIKVGNTLGKVVEIQTRATILKAVDGTKVIVPNATIFRSQVVSYTTNPTRRVSIPLYISYDTDIKFAIKIALDILKKYPKLLKKPAPSIIVKGYGDSTIDLEARFWVGSRDGWIKIKSELMHDLLEAFYDAGIEIPYNITHIETDTDTREDFEKNAKLRKQKMAEMKLSRAIEKDAKEKTPPTAPAAITTDSTAIATTTSTAPNTAATNAAAPNATTVTPAVQVSGDATTTAQLAPAVVLAQPDPTGAYADMTEIDGQG